ncbi:hypothetical protein RA27_20590 [Ruegeria sp. ANG-R]|nr:hypothetical protein RA27_20590 [Ruegeria sp. ANG-R]
MPPFSDVERDFLAEAAADPKGSKLKSKDQKQIARMLALRGLVMINKSTTRMVVTPAGRFVLSTK